MNTNEYLKSREILDDNLRSVNTNEYLKFREILEANLRSVITKEYIKFIEILEGNLLCVQEVVTRPKTLNRTILSNRAHLA